MPAAEKLFLNELAADIVVNKPAIIFVHNTLPCSGMPAEFEMLTYLRHVHFIDGAMRDYVLDTTVLDFAMYLRRDTTETQLQGGRQNRL